MLCMLAAAFTSHAQQYVQPQGNPLWEESTAREAFPNIAVFVYPQICDIKMLSEERVQFGAYPFSIGKDGKLSDEDIRNDKSRALHNACIDAKADLIIEPLYTLTIYDADPRKLFITVSGYPAKYINFRSLSTDDISMIRALYPGGVERMQEKGGQAVITSGVEQR